MGPSHTVNDISDGTMYEQGLDMYCSMTPPPGVDKILPLPLLGFCDESHLDNNDGNKTTPVSFNLPCSIRMHARSTTTG